MSKTDKRKKTRSKAKPHSAVAAFLVKTYEILEDPDYNDIACWNKEGNAFIVKNVTEFSDKILPKYFKHNNFASFVRQLNMYDFHKTRHENNENEFRHRLFKRGQKHLLGEIKRKIAEPHEANQLVPVSSGLDVDKFKKEAGHFTTELKTLKNRQGDLEKLSKTIYEQNTKLLKENKLLWGELVKNKEKYERKIEKLMVFVFSVMQHTGNNKAIEYLDNKKSIGPADLSESLSDIGTDEPEKTGDNNDTNALSLASTTDKKDHEKFMKNLGKYFQSKGNKSNIDKLMEVMKKGAINGDNFSGLPINFNEDKPDNKINIALPSTQPNTGAPHQNTRSSRRNGNQRMKLPDSSEDFAQGDPFQELPSKFVKAEKMGNPVRNVRQQSNISNGFNLDNSVDAPNLDQSFDLNRFDSVNKESPLLPPSMMFPNPGNQDFLESPKPMLNLMKSDSMPPFRLSEENPELGNPRDDPMSLLSFPQSNLDAKREPSQGDLGYFDGDLGPFSPGAFLSNNREGYNFGQ